MYKTRELLGCNLGRQNLLYYSLEFKYVDFTVALQLSENGNKHALNIVDQFTKFIFLYVISNRTVKILTKYIYMILV